MGRLSRLTLRQPRWVNPASQAGFFYAKCLSLQALTPVRVNSKCAVATMGWCFVRVNNRGGSLSNELKVRVMPASVGIWLIVLAVTLRA